MEKPRSVFQKLLQNLAKEIAVCFEADVNHTVLSYAIQVLNLGLLQHGFNDSIQREMGTGF